MANLECDLVNCELIVRSDDIQSYCVRSPHCQDFKFASLFSKNYHKFAAAFLLPYMLSQLSSWSSQVRSHSRKQSLQFSRKSHLFLDKHVSSFFPRRPNRLFDRPSVRRHSHQWCKYDPSRSGYRAPAPASRAPTTSSPGQPWRRTYNSRARGCRTIDQSRCAPNPTIERGDRANRSTTSTIEAS